MPDVDISITADIIVENYKMDVSDFDKTQNWIEGINQQDLLK